MTFFSTVFLIHALVQWLTSVARIHIMTVLSILQWKIPQNGLHRTLIPQSIGRCFEKTSHGYINLTKHSLKLPNCWTGFFHRMSSRFAVLMLSENSLGKTPDAQLRNIHSRSPLFLDMSHVIYFGTTALINAVCKRLDCFYILAIKCACRHIIAKS